MGSNPRVDLMGPYLRVGLTGSNLEGLSYRS